MARISDIISKVVISLFHGSEEGVVENLLLNPANGKAKYLVVFQEKNDITYLLPVSKIYSVGTHAITIKNNSCLELLESKELELNELCNPIHSNAYQISGEWLGVVTDAELNKEFEAKSIFVGNLELNMANISSFNKTTTLVQQEPKKVNLKNFYERKKAPILVADTRQVNIVELPNKEQGATIPNRAIANYSFLINRKVQRNILSTEGNLIIKQNSRIDPQTIHIARQNGKLKELTKYSSI